MIYTLIPDTFFFILKRSPSNGICTECNQVWFSTWAADENAITFFRRSNPGPVEAVLSVHVCVRAYCSSMGSFLTVGQVKVGQQGAKGNIHFSAQIYPVNWQSSPPKTSVLPPLCRSTCQVCKGGRRAMSTSVSVQTQVDVGLVFSMERSSPEPGVVA